MRREPIIQFSLFAHTFLLIDDEEFITGGNLQSDKRARKVLAIFSLGTNAIKLLLICLMRCAYYLLMIYVQTLERVYRLIIITVLPR